MSADYERCCCNQLDCDMCGDEWRTTSGLTKGGCPGGVMPEDLERHQHAADRVISAAREYVRHLPVDDKPVMPLLANLMGTVADYDAAWPEE